MKFERFGNLLEGEQLAGDLEQVHLDLSGRRIEELATGVDPIDAPIGQTLVQSLLDADSIVGEQQGMFVEAKGNRGVAKLANPILRLKASGETNLDDALAEGTDMEITYT